jgi:hypothetical protein
MNDVDEKIARLVRSAGSTSEDVSEQAPFGFDTRVVALWHASEQATSLGLGRLIQRVGLAAAGVIVIATAGAYRESNRNLEKSEPFANEFAIADSAIQDEFLQ